MKRKLMSLMVASAVLLSLPLSSAAAMFSDTKDTNQSLAISVLQSLGIVNGYEDGTFRPDEYLSRAQFSKFAVTVMGLGEQAASYASKTLFTDVKGGTWAAGYVNLAYSQGLINGYGNGVFGADDGVTYGQAVTIMLRILGYKAAQIGSIWPDDYVAYASRSGLNSGLNLSAGDKLTRGEAAALLYNLLTMTNSSGQAYYTTISSAATKVNDAVITSANSGNVTYRSAAGEKTVRAAYTFSDNLKNLRGTLLLSSTGSAVGFVPDKNTYKDITVSNVDSVSITDTAGYKYNIGSNINILGSKAACAFGNNWYELLVGSDVRLYFDSDGKTALIYSADYSEPHVTTKIASVVVTSFADNKVNYLSAGEENEAELDTDSYKDWIGERGTLLLNSDTKAVGFIPDVKAYKDITVSSVKAAGITADNGSYYKLDAGTQLYLNGSVYTYTNSWYDITKDCGVRLYYTSAGKIDLVYVQGGSIGNSAAVAETSGVKSELAGKLGIPSSVCKLIKNGYVAGDGELAQYDVGQYDGVTNTLTVTDSKITGCLSDIDYAGGEASKITILGNTFAVMDSALDTVRNFKEGDMVTLLMTSDNKIAAVYSPQTVSANMRGVLKLSGTAASVKLTNGITISGPTFSTDIGSLDGSLVNVSVTTDGKLAITAISSDVTGPLDLSAKTLGKYKLAPNVKIYDWAGNGAVINVDPDDITWTSTLASDAISYAGTNSAGEIDTILLKDVTGDVYTYGIATVTTKTSTGALAANKSVSVTNRNGASSFCQMAYNIATGDYIGISARADGKLAGYRTLNAIKGVPLSGFKGDGHVSAGGYYFTISDNVQVYDSSSKTWMTQEEAIAKSDSFTVYYDRIPDNGGKVRIIVAE